MKHSLHARFATAALAAAGLLVAGPSRSDDTQRAGMPSDFMPPEMQDVGIKEHLGEQLPGDVTLRDEAGREVQLGQFFKGSRPIALNFVYHSCPMLCSMVLTGFTSSARELSLSIGKDFDVITVSIDPKDTPAVAAEKKAHWMGIYGRDAAVTGAGWHFLTGDARESKRLADAVGFSYKYDAQQKQYAHSAAVFLVSPGGKMSRYLYGIQFPSKDFRLGLAEAAEGKVSTALDHLLLFCYQYDPNSRGYVLAAWKIMRAGAALTAVALGALLGVLWMRERRRAPPPPSPPGAPDSLQPDLEG